MSAITIYSIFATVYFNREGIQNSDAINTIFVDTANSIAERYNATYTNNLFAFQLTCDFIRSMYLREGDISNDFSDTIFNLVATTLSSNINNFDGVSLASANTDTKNNDTSNV